MYENILVPVDMGDHSIKSIDEAIMLADAGDEDTVVHGLHVFQIDRDKEVFENNRDEYPSHIDRLVEKAEERDIGFKTTTEQGVPAEKIQDYAEEYDIDAIVMATNARSRDGLFEQFFVDSVTEKTQRNVSCSVIALPPDDTDSEDDE